MEIGWRDSGYADDEDEQGTIPKCRNQNRNHQEA